MAIDWDRVKGESQTELRGLVQPLCDHQRIGERATKPSKYKNVRTLYDGILYDSKAEAGYAAQLDLLLRAGSVAWWLRQVPVRLGKDTVTRVDFLVCGKLIAPKTDVIVVEIKGAETKEFCKIRKLWPQYAPFDMHVVKRGIVEVIKGQS